MTRRGAHRLSRTGWGFVVVAMIAALAVCTWVVPPHRVVLHNVLHHLNILPFMFAGLLFGWRGAARAILLAAVLQAPALVLHWKIDLLDAQDQVVELSTFAIAGLIAGAVADRERTQRRHVESTKTELESVYLELRENIDQLRKNERLSAAGQLAASLAHEIRNPLASIGGAAGILARGHAAAGTQAECLDILLRESQRLNKLLTNFLDFARPRLPRLQPTDPVALVQSTVSLVQPTARDQGVELIAEPASHPGEVACDAEQIRQVLLNLVLNALEASHPGTEVQVRVVSGAGQLIWQIEDHGRGVAPEVLDNIFDPFFTTRKNGTGLGLAIAANIVRQHGGTLTAVRNAGPGMTFSIVLPREPEPVRRATAATVRA